MEFAINGFLQDVENISGRLSQVAFCEQSNELLIFIKYQF
jgi:hypothetical protein